MQTINYTTIIKSFIQENTTINNNNIKNSIKQQNQILLNNKTCTKPNKSQQQSINQEAPIQYQSSQKSFLNFNSNNELNFELSAKQSNQLQQNLQFQNSFLNMNCNQFSKQEFDLFDNQTSLFAKQSSKQIAENNHQNNSNPSHRKSSLFEIQNAPLNTEFNQSLLNNYFSSDDENSKETQMNSSFFEIQNNEQELEAEKSEQYNIDPFFQSPLNTNINSNSSFMEESEPFDTNVNQIFPQFINNNDDNKNISKAINFEQQQKQQNFQVNNIFGNQKDPFKIIKVSKKINKFGNLDKNLLNSKKNNKNYDKNICKYLTRTIIRAFANFEYMSQIFSLTKEQLPKYSEEEIQTLYSESTIYFTRNLEVISGPRVLKEFLNYEVEEDPQIKSQKIVFRAFYKWFLKYRISRYILQGKMDNKKMYISYKNNVMLNFSEKLDQWNSNKPVSLQ